MKEKNIIKILIIIILIISCLVADLDIELKEIKDNCHDICISREDELYRKDLIKCIDDCDYTGKIVDNFISVHTDDEYRFECYCRDPIMAEQEQRE